MRNLLLLAALAALSVPTFAQQRQVQVDGHVRKDGTYVPPHYRTTPDSSRSNNWGSQGNTNPHTGQEGKVDPWAPQQPRSR
jgi:hypothetical protein